MVRRVTYLVLYDEPVICDHGFMHSVHSAVSNIKTVEQAIALANKYDGTIEEVEEEINIEKVLICEPYQPVA